MLIDYIHIVSFQEKEVLALVVQGNLLGLDSSHIYLYSNTLQSIAVGYLIAAVIQLHFSFRWQIGITLLLLFIYWIPMTFLGDFTPAGNFAEQVERGAFHLITITHGYGAV